MKKRFFDAFLFCIFLLNCDCWASLVQEVNQNAYGQQYWTYQKKIGVAGGILNLFKFNSFIQPEDTVIDFGCGGGFLLNNIKCRAKIGVEVNPSAREHAESLGLLVYSDLGMVPDEIADVIISNHVLEHVFNPYETLRALYKKLKIGGKLVLVVPSEQASDRGYAYKENDANQHIYTWTPMTLGNLVHMSGFEIIKAEALQHCWTNDYLACVFSEQFDLDAYHERCHEEAIKKNNYQVRVVATRNA